MKSPELVASECCAGLYPLNTSSGFMYCVEQQFDGIEFDVHLSADGHVVVHHDYLLNARITRDASGHYLENPGAPLCRRTLADLRTFDVGRYRDGSREARLYPDYQPIDHEPIPTLDELLACHRAADSTADLLIELKTTPFERATSSDPVALTDAVLAAIARHDRARYCILLAFEWDVLVRAKALNPALRCNFLTMNATLLLKLNSKPGDVDPHALYGSIPVADPDQPWQAIAAAGGEWWGPLCSDVSRASVAAAQAAGVKVNLWYVESDATSIRSAIALAPDAITLDRPDLVPAIIERDAGG